MNSTRSTLLKVDKVDRVALAPYYTLATKSTVSATKSTELATMSTATSCRIQIVADLLPKPATKSTVSATVDFVADLSPVSATVDFVASVYTGLKRQQCELGQRLFVAGCRFSADVPLTASDRIEPVKENEKHTIVIKKVVKAEEGVINVKATNEVGQMSASARLKVTGIPEYRTYSLIFIAHQTRDIDIGILSIRPSVCLSVRYVPVFYENGITYTGFRKITATKNNSHFSFLA